MTFYLFIYNKIFIYFQNFSEDGCTVQCKRKWPSASDLCITMFTVPSARLCFDNLSSQNSPRKGSSVGLHKCMHAHADTQNEADRVMNGGSCI